MTSSGIMPTKIPKAVALAPSDFAYSTIGLLKMIWNENALKTENQNAFVNPGGNRSGGGGSAVAFKTFPDTALADTLSLGNGARRIA